MKQGLCNRDIFFAPTGGEIICRGIIDANDIMTGQMCSVSCEAALAVPDRINCNPDGWDVEASSCDATNGGLSPGGQIAIIILCLGLLCLGTFLWQRYKRSKAPVADAANAPKYAGDVPDFDKDLTFGMGRDGFDNLQTVNLGEMTPLPQPRNRPGGGYHPAGRGIHDFMGTCTIGTVSQNPKLGEWKEPEKNLA